MRLVEGLAQRFDLTLVIREAFGTRSISWPPVHEAFNRVPGPAGRATFTAFALRWLHQHRTRYDAVLVQNHGLAALAANVARLRSHATTFQLICSPSEAYFRCRREKRKIGLLPYLGGRALLRSLRTANRWIGGRYVVLSKFLADIVGKDRTHVIPLYGVDTELFRPPTVEERRKARLALGFSEDMWVVFFSSRVAPEKDAETLVAACAALRQEIPSLLLFNASGGHAEFEALAGRMSAKDRVRAVPAVRPYEELRRIYWAADVCVQASLEEGLGFSPLEALACHLPVIATAVGGLCETIQSQRTGLSVPPRDQDALKTALLWARDHPQEMARLAANGREMVVSSFDSRAVWGRFQELIEVESSLEEFAKKKP